MAMTRHEFLQALHRKLKPKVYLETGVQFGESLRLAEDADLAIGIDPFPMVDLSPNRRDNQQICPMDSDTWFSEPYGGPPIDFAFIDGMHLVEYALRDWLNVQKMMRPGGIIVFDDVLPYNAAIAARQMPPGGDWTGDVWKMFYILVEQFHLEPLLVDTFPTGTMVLLNVEPKPSYLEHERWFMPAWLEDMEPRPEIIDRSSAYTAEQILEML